MAVSQSFNIAGAPSNSNAQSTAQIQLPPPQIFDILPQLHEILARIDHSDSTLSPNLQATDCEKGLGAAYAELQPLEPKDLPTEVLPIKAKIRKALKELEELPDMDRTVEDQQDEITELEERIEKQKEALRALAAVAKGLGAKLGAGS